MVGVRDVIERRVNVFGVSEPVVQTSVSGEQYRVIVELAGISDVDQAIQMIGETPLLEFKEQAPQARELTEAERAQMGRTDEAVGGPDQELAAPDRSVRPVARPVPPPQFAPSFDSSVRSD